MRRWKRRNRAGGLGRPPLQNRVMVFSLERVLAAKLPEAEKQVACWIAALMVALLRVPSQEWLLVPWRGGVEVLVAWSRGRRGGFAVRAFCSALRLRSRMWLPWPMPVSCR